MANKPKKAAPASNKPKTTANPKRSGTRNNEPKKGSPEMQKNPQQGHHHESEEGQAWY